MADANTRRLSVIEIISVLAVAGGALWGVVEVAGKVTDRLALMEASIVRLQHDMTVIENGSPLVNARLDAQRKDLDKLDTRLHALEVEDRK